MASQGLSSASNFLLSLFVLASVETASFARFALCLTVYLLLLQLARYFIGIPVLMEPDDASVSGAARTPLGVAVASGVVVAPILVGGAVLWRAGATLLVVLALAMPLLLAQDVLRHAAIASGRPALAAWGDGVWVALQLAGSGAGALAVGRMSATVLTAIWAGAGAVSAAVLARCLRAAPARWHATSAWLTGHSRLCRRLAVEWAVTSGSYYVLCFGLAALAGSPELGYLRAAQTLFGPASVLLLGGAVLGVPESVRMRAEHRRLVRFALVLSGGLAALSLACGATVYGLLGRFGPSQFPGSWVAIRAVIPWLTAFGAAIGAGAGAVAGLRALDASGWIMRARGITGGVAVVTGLPSGMWFGARGTFAALAVAEAVLAVRAWSELGRRRPAPITPAAPLTRAGSRAPAVEPVRGVARA